MLVGIDNFVQVIFGVSQTSDLYVIATWVGLSLIVVSMALLFVWPQFRNSTAKTE